MATTTRQTTTQATPMPPLSDAGAKAIDAVSAISEASQRIGGHLIEMWASTASDRLRTLAELQTAAMEASRTAFAPMTAPRDAFEALVQDPTAWYRKGVTSMLDGTQRVLKLMEENAQIVARSAERFQGSAERTGHEIESAVQTCASRLRELYTARS